MLRLNKVAFGFRIPSLASQEFSQIRSFFCSLAELSDAPKLYFLLISEVDMEPVVAVVGEVVIEEQRVLFTLGRREVMEPELVVEVVGTEERS